MGLGVWDPSLVDILDTLDPRVLKADASVLISAPRRQENLDNYLIRTESTPLEHGTGHACTRSVWFERRHRHGIFSGNRVLINQLLLKCWI